jgi:uncharacterized membrane protein YeaQ/YmgE (transglycosylase-associated protein family)
MYVCHLPLLGSKDEVLPFPRAEEANAAAALPKSQLPRVMPSSYRTTRRRLIAHAGPYPSAGQIRWEAKSQLEVDMGIIAWIILGLLAGVIAKALLPGDDPGGLIITTLIGIAGAFVGGLIVKALGFGDPIDEFFDFSTWLGAIAGAILLLLVYRAFVGRGTRGRTAY